MKYVKYSKYVADPFDDLSAEDLLQMLGDFLLDSGFYNQYQNIYDMDPERTMEQLHQALLEALRDQGKIPDDLLQQMLQNWEDYQNSELAEKINKLLERLSEEGYVSVEQPNPTQGQIMEREGGALRRSAQRARPSLKLQTRRWTFWDSKPCATCWAHWESPASAGTIRASSRPASSPRAPAAATSSATR